MFPHIPRWFLEAPGVEIRWLRPKNNDFLTEKIDLLEIDRDTRGSIGDCSKVVMGPNMVSVDLQYPHFWSKYVFEKNVSEKHKIQPHVPLNPCVWHQLGMDWPKWVRPTPLSANKFAGNGSVKPQICKIDQMRLDGPIFCKLDPFTGNSWAQKWPQKWPKKLSKKMT